MQGRTAAPTLAAALLLLGGCDDRATSRADGPPSYDLGGPETYAVGGNVLGLAGGVLLLRNNGADEIRIIRDGAFTFPTRLVDQAPYDVRIAAQPDGQLCSVTNGVGRIAGADVTDVQIACQITDGPFPLYPLHGADWNDYVKNDGTGPFDASDTPCDAENDGPDYFACIHGGERRVLSVSDRMDCDGITAEDDLGAFAWVCDPGTSPVRVVSTGLRDDKGLTDLLDFEADPPTWRTNSVRVRDGADVIRQTAPLMWWNNPVAADPVADDAESTIYVVTKHVPVEPLPRYRYTLGRSAGFVVQPGFTVGAWGTDGALLVAQPFAWVEGAFDGSDGISLTFAPFSVLRNLTLVVSGGVGVQMLRSPKGLLTRIAAFVDDGGAVWIYESDGTTVTDLSVRCGAAGGLGVQLQGDDHRIDDVQTEGCSGVFASNAWGLRLSNLSVARGDYGFYADSLSLSYLWNIRLLGTERGLTIDGAAGGHYIWNLLRAGDWYEDCYGGHEALYAGVTSVSGSSALFHESSFVANATMANGSGFSHVTSYGTLQGVAAVGGSSDGLYIRSTDGRFRNIVATGHAERAVHLQEVESGRFDGLFKVGGNAGQECLVEGGASPGLVDDAVGDTNCGIEGASTATVMGSTTVADSFVGPVTVDDAANTSDVDGAAPYESIMDWVNFENPYRAWGRDDAGLPFPDPAHIGQCQPGETCRIWDWSLRSTDTVLRGVLSPPGGDDVSWHRWTWAGEGPCALEPGAVWDEGSGACVSIFLQHALELQLDDIGNDNLLCESGETCIFTPNIGSYQGHGELVPHSIIGTGGAIENVTLLQYETNGR